MVFRLDFSFWLLTSHLSHFFFLSNVHCLQMLLRLFPGISTIMYMGVFYYSNSDHHLLYYQGRANFVSTMTRNSKPPVEESIRRTEWSRPQLVELARSNIVCGTDNVWPSSAREIWTFSGICSLWTSIFPSQDVFMIKLFAESWTQPPHTRTCSKERQ
jgi:hypothetical protein